MRPRLQTQKPEGDPARPAGVWLDRAMLALALAVALVVAVLYLL